MSIQKFSINEVKYEIEKISEKYRTIYIDEHLNTRMLLTGEFESTDLAKHAAINHFETHFA